MSEPFQMTEFFTKPPVSSSNLLKFTAEMRARAIASVKAGTNARVEWAQDLAAKYPGLTIPEIHAEVRKAFGRGVSLDTLRDAVNPVKAISVPPMPTVRPAPKRITPKIPTLPTLEFVDALPATQRAQGTRERHVAGVLISEVVAALKTKPGAWAIIWVGKLGENMSKTAYLSTQLRKQGVEVALRGINLWASYPSTP